MTKEEKNNLYEKLHEEIGTKVGLTPVQVRTIRSFTIGNGLGKVGLIEMCERKLSMQAVPRSIKRKKLKENGLLVWNSYRRYPKKHYQEILNFINHADFGKQLEVIKHVEVNGIML